MSDDETSPGGRDADATGTSPLAVVREVAPGVAFLVVLAVLARVASTLVPYASALVVAVALGIVLTNTVGVPERLQAGSSTHKLWLEAGIVLMGARVSLGTLVDTGAQLAVLVVGIVALTLVLVEVLARGVFDVHRKLGSLLAAGASVCGVSAAVGVAGSVRATEEHVAYAAGTILLFDVVTLFTYPALGGVLGLSDRVFGVWAGLTMFSTGPVTAAGFAFSDAAGQWATVTKLTRNLLLGVLVGAYSIRYANPGSDDADGAPGEDASTASAFSPRRLWDAFPKFVLGFFAVVVLTSTAVVSDAATAQLTNAYRWLFLLAFVGLGLSVDVADLRDTGVTPIALLLTALVTTSVVALVAVRALLGA
ncbi:YeiH family protein [Halorubellus salinus]|uniref:YeiH family protein n=1 Tax=Halorubellus salinus TaxID=755309 RepID=UPI001D077286|nr:putative sulfate exporter family transporter [Halorubellus salinus]